MELNNLENVMDVLNKDIPNLKYKSKNKHFHEPSHTTITLKTSEKLFKKYPNAICMIIADYGIAGTAVQSATILKGLPRKELINYVNYIIENSWWNK